MKNTFTLFLFSLFLIYAGKCQEGELQLYQNGYHIRQYSEISGLASNRCKRVFEDSRGFLWVFTFQGLSRFDGREFVNFGINEGLPGSNITQVCEDSSGYIYVANTSGIARYTGYNKKARSYFYVYPQTRGLSSGIFGLQAIDSTTIIFQLGDGSVNLLKNGIIKELTPKSSYTHIRMLHMNYQYFYAFTKDTIRVFNKKGEVVNNIYSSSAFVNEGIDPLGRLHVYSQGLKNIINGKEIISSSSLPDSIIWFDCLDTSGNMIYYKEGSIYHYANGISNWIVDLKKVASSSNSVTVTRDGSIWVATRTNGIFRLKPLLYKEIDSTAHTQYYTHINNKKFAVNEQTKDPRLDSLRNISESILVDKNGITWFCTQNGLYKAEPGKKPVLYTFPGNKNYWNVIVNRVDGGVETTAGDIWFYGTGGLILYRDGKFTHYNNKNGLNPNAERVLRVEIDKDGTVLLIDNHRKLMIVQGDTIISVNKPAGLTDFTPTLFKRDQKGNLWVEHNKKIYKMVRTATRDYIVTDSIVQFPYSGNPEIRSFDFDMQNNCWVGYAGGKIQVFFSNADGRYQYLNSVLYTRDDGLTPIATCEYNLCPDEKGNMLVVQSRQGAKKMYVFSIEQAIARKKMQAAKINLTEVFINHEPADWTKMGYVTGAAGMPSYCKLNYADNNIIFNYTGISLSNPGSIMYKTLLKGYDNRWQTTNTTMAIYTNLPPGRYTFLVKAANANGVWGDATEYAFTISPPWYKTWWAILLWIVLSGSMILFLLYLRISAIRMSTLRESNTFKSSLIGLIGHDMMTPLHYIAKVSSQLKMHSGKLSQKTTIDSLGDITVTASRLRFFGESILHWINLQNSEFSPAVEKFRVNDTIKDLVDFHQLLAVEKDNTVSHHIHDDLFCYQDPTLIKIILHNLLLNANKFTANGKIMLSAIVEDEWLIVKVTDTGKGMDQSKVESLNQLQPISSSPGTLKEKGWGMGYKMIIDLLKFSKGTLHINSRINEGTEVTIRLFSGQKEYSHKLKVAS